MCVRVYEYICEWRRCFTLSKGYFLVLSLVFHCLRSKTLKLKSNYNSNTSFDATLHCDSFTNVQNAYCCQFCRFLTITLRIALPSYRRITKNHLHIRIDHFRCRPCFGIRIGRANLLHLDPTLRALGTVTHRRVATAILHNPG